MTMHVNDLPADLPANIPSAARDEIVGFLQRVEPDTSCLVTGSLVEGIGNSHSDVDFYVIQPESTKARPVAIGSRGARFVDCEYLPVQGLVLLAERMADPSARTLMSLEHRDFDRYYRIAIGIPLVMTEKVGVLLRRFSKAVACERFAAWSLLVAYQYLGRAAVSDALSQRWRASVQLRETALWRASQVLAEAGEGYPAAKWTETKAARRFGMDTQPYHDCLDAYLTFPEDFCGTLAALRERIGPPAAALAEMRRYRWRLADGVSLMADGDRRYLIGGHRSLAAVSGAVAPVLERMWRGVDWPVALAEVAEDLDVSQNELLAASFTYLKELRAAGYLALDDCDEE